LGQEAIFDELVNAVLSFDADKVMDTTRKALSQGIDPVSIIDDGLAKGLRVVGKKFEDGELFLMHLVAAAEAVQRALKELLEPEISKRKEKREFLGRIVIGTVAGDIHDIGKNIVAALLFASGFETHDLGKDVPVEEFVNKAKAVDANIVAASALLSTTLPVQHEIVKALVAQGMRDKVKIMVGGAPVTEEWVREIGGDGYAENAVEAVKAAKRLLNIRE
jgi:corrinoid protein of di/trimethylamine methyltransferase